MTRSLSDDHQTSPLAAPAGSLGFGVTLDLAYDDVVTRVKEALKAEGFGVLTEIDVRKTLHEKIGVEMDPYLILGACNPPLAHRAIQQEPTVGLLLPCNVVVRTVGNATRVDIVDPEAMLSVVDDEGLTPVASEAKTRLQRVAAALGANG